MDRKTGVIAMFAASAVLLALFIGGEKASGNIHADPHGEGNSTSPNSVASQSPLEIVSNVGAHRAVPDDVKKHGIRASYEFLRDCITYVRFGAIMQREAHNPEFALNNPRLMSKLPSITQDRLNRYASIVQSKERECGSFSSPENYAAASREMYDLALELGKKGDVEAATCFVEAPWAVPSGPSAEAEELESIYAKNAKNLADYGIRQGNWRSVMAAFHAGQAEHGISSNIGYSVEERYSLARLLQMGSIDPELSSAYGYDAARLSANLNATVIASADKRANYMFESYYNGRGMAADSALSQNCGI